MATSQAELYDLIQRVSESDLRNLVVAETYRRSFRKFVTPAWHVHHPTPLVESWYIDAICEHLEAVTRGEIKKLLINIPPRLLKSFLVSVYWPAWQWTTRPEKQFLCVSAVDKVVLRDAVRMHDLVDSDWYQHWFQPDWTWSEQQDAKGYYTNTKHGHRISVTTGQRITGGGGDVTIIDDPHDAQYVLRNSVQIEKDIQYLDEVLSTRKNNPDDPTVCVMQRLHGHDYSGHITDTKTGWVHLVIPNEYDKPRRTMIVDGGIEKELYHDQRKNVGELLCPKRIGTERVKELKEDLGEVGYSAQYQQDPVPASGMIFNRDLFRFWNRDTLPRQFDFVFGSWDCTFTKSTDSDFVVGQLWGMKAARAYLLGQLRRKMEFQETVAAMLDQWKHAKEVYGLGMRFLAVELKANGPRIIKALEQSVPGIVGFNPQGETKEGRARAVQPYFQAGQVFFPDENENEWMRKIFLPEVKYFPLWRRDDQVDAMTQALLMVYEQGSFFIARASKT